MKVRAAGMQGMADNLAELQARFAAHIRDPETAPAPEDVEDRRMAIYRDLFFRNLSNFVARSFPVLKSLLAQARWDALMRRFFIEHHARTPLFPEIAREFLQFLQDLAEREPLEPPFMLELAHYEWVEIALDLDEQEIGAVEVDARGDLLSGEPVVSPLAWPLSYNWPVHRIRPGFQPSEPPAEPTHLLVYRDRSDQVRFMQLNAMSALLLRRLKEDSGRSGHDLLTTVAAELQHPDPDKVMSAGRQLLGDLRERDVILGTRPRAD